MTTDNEVVDTLPRIASLMGVHRQTMYSWRDQADFPQPVRAGRPALYRLADIEAWRAGR